MHCISQIKPKKSVISKNRGKQLFLTALPDKVDEKKWWNEIVNRL